MSEGIRSTGTQPTLSIGRIQRHLRDSQRSSLIEIVNCALNAGCCYSLVGESGIGKTTALEMLALAQKPDHIDHFRLNLAGKSLDLAALLAADNRSMLSDIRARHFGYVTQTSLLLPFLTVLENIELAQTLAGRRDTALIAFLVDRLQLGPLVKAMPGTLSGGQRQRVCVARALAHRPDVILADEPTSAVDAEMGRLIVQMIRSLVHQTGAIALIITHNLSLAREFSLLDLAVDSVSGPTGMRTMISSPASVPVTAPVSQEAML